MSRHRTLSVPSWSRKLLDLLARLRRWRRYTWMGRAPSLWPAGQIVARSKTPLVTPTRLALEQLERRETPNDVMNLLQGGFAWGGLLLVNKLDTPASVAMKGWTPASLPPASAPAPTSIPDAYAATPWETAQEVPWTPQILGLSPTESSEAAPPSTNPPLVMGPSEQQPAQPISDDAWTEWGQESQTPTRPRGLGKSSVENNAAGGGGSPHSTPSTGGLSSSNSGGSMAGLSSTVPSLGGNSSSTTSNGPAASPGIFVTNTSAVGTASATSQPILSLGTLLMTPGNGVAGSTVTNPISGNGSSSGNPSGATPAGSTTNASAATQAAVQAEYGQLPLRFEVNEGQVDSSVQFVAQGLNYGVYLTGNGALLGLTRTADSSTTGTSDSDPNNPSTGPTDTSTTYITDVLGLQLVGANQQAQAVGVNELATKSNYLIGNDPNQWHTNVANYAQVEYQNVYSGVNLIYYGNSQGQLETDFDVAPGADPGVIQFTIQGAQALALDAQGNLIITTESGGTLTQQTPTLYQEVNGVRQAVTGSYSLEGNNQIGFQVGAYNASMPLTIDPVLLYSTYVGGSGFSGDGAVGIAVDSSGNAYISGYTYSTNFPTTTGAYQSTFSGSTNNSDVFVSKLNADGTGLVYSTYLGGTSSDAATGMALNSSGDVYVTGSTNSTNFPTTSGAYQTRFPATSGAQSSFVTELNASGSSLVYSTYLGGTGNSIAKSIAIDSSGNAYITGSAGSSFPTTVGAYQTNFTTGNGFLTELNASGSSPVYSTYLGGSATITSNAVAVDSSGEAYVTGYTSSTAFPTSGAYQSSNAGGIDAFVMKLNASGSSLDFSTYLGGAGSDQGYAIAVDSSGAAYVTGKTGSTNFPTTAGVYQTANMVSTSYVSAFVSKLDGSGSLVYSTYLGGPFATTNPSDWGTGIVVDSSGEAYVTGVQNSEYFPTTPDAYQTAPSEGPFVTELNATGASLIYSTVFGNGQANNAIALDSSGAVYVTGTAGSFFPITPGAFQTAYGGGLNNGDAFVAKLGPSWLSASVVAKDPLQSTTIQVGDATVSTQDGDLSTSIPLQLAVSSNSDCGCGDQLVYNSNASAPQLIVEAVFQPDASYGVPTQIQAQLSWSDYTGNWVTFSTSGCSAGDTYDLVLQVPIGYNTGAGFYPWQIEVKATLSNGVTTDSNYFGTAFADIVSTPFGNNWTLGSLDHLVIGTGTSAGLVAYMYGTGGYRVFTSQGNGVYTGQSNEFGTLTSAKVGSVATYTYSLNGTTKTFTQAGLLDHTTYPNGEITTYIYSSNQLSKVLKPDGAVSTFVYTSGLVSSIQEPGGHVVTLTHNSTTLTNVTLPDGSVASFTYDTSQRMLTNAWGSLRATYTYASMTGLISTAYLGGGETLTFAPAPLQSLITTTGSTSVQTVGTMADVNGDITTFQYDALGLPTQETTPDGATQSFQRDAAGDVTVYTDGNDNVTSYTYDAYGDVLTETDPNGSVSSYQYNATYHEVTQAIDPNGNITTYQYDSAGELTETIDPQGDVTTQVWSSGLLQNVIDPRGDITSYSYNSALQMTSMTTADGTTTYTYDAAGNVKTVTDPLGRVTTNTYDGLDRLLTQTTPDGGVTTYLYDKAGDLLSETDPLGHVTSYSYDSRGDQISVTEAYGTAVARTTTNVYNSLGELLSTTDAKGNITSYAYDSLGRQTEEIDGYGSSVQSITTTVYDAAGNVLSMTDPNGNITSYAYDSLNRLTEEIDAYGTSIASTTTMIYDAAGNLLSETTGQSTTVSYAHPSTTSFAYDSLNRQTEEIDAYGTSAQRITTTIYDTAGNVLSMMDANGNITSYAYDSLNRVIEEIDAYGTSIASTTTMIYDAAGNLLSETTGQSTTVAYAHTSTTSFAYDVLNRQTEEIDAYGTSVQRITTTVYDKAGNVLSTMDGDGHVTSYAYDALNQETKEIDGYGTAVASTTTMLYDTVGNLLSETTGQSSTVAYAHVSTTSFAYDALNRQTEEIDAYGTSIASTTTMLYDTAGNLLSETAGQSTTVAYAHSSTTSFAYDVLSRQTQEIDAYGTSIASTTTMIYDAAGNLLSETTGQSTTVAYAHPSTTSFAYDALNQQTEQIEGYGSSVASTSSMVYDTAGNLLSTTDGNGNITSYAYDALNRQIEEIDAYSTSISSTATMLYDAAGNLLSETTGQSTTASYANTSTTSYSYDALNRTIEEIDAYATSIASTTTMIHDAASNLLSETTGQSTTVAYAHPSTTSYAYDALNRQTQEIDAYGVVGVQRTTSAVYDAAGNAVQSYDALDHVTTYTYNALNQQITEQTPAGGTATTVYDANGNVLAQIDQLGHATSYSYDALNRQITETDGDGYTTTYAYDAASNQISVTDADNNTTTMVFDVLNRQISETDPLNHTSTAVYDTAGNLISTTDRDGRLETYSYDALNRETGATWIVDGSTTNVQTFTYDAADNQLTAADYNGAYTMAYDVLNHLTSDQEPFGQVLTYSYDAANNQIQIQDSQGGTTTSVYNALDELTTREFGGTDQTPLREDLTYTALGQIATETRYTDLAGTQVAGTSSYVYDTDGRLTDLTQTYANGSVLTSYVYNYNQASLLTSEVDDGVTTSYSYDNANQLTQAGTATYGYDATGNRTNTGYQTGPDNQLLSDGTYSYTYDNEGNLETKQAGNDITTYSYNNQNELIGVIETVGGTLTMQATYIYDVFGNRLEADDYQGGITTVTRSAYNGSNAWEDLNGSNVLQMRYFYLDGQNQMLARVDSSGNLAWYGTDHLGSLRIVLNAAGTTVLDQIIYDAYGNITSESSPANRGNYGYAGYLLDSATGLYKAGDREYSPWTQTWTSQDPIFADVNLYRYVGNDPTNFVDPSGLVGDGINPDFWQTFFSRYTLWFFAGEQPDGKGGHEPIMGGVWKQFIKDQTTNALIALPPTRVGTAVGAGIDLTNQGLGKVDDWLKNRKVREIDFNQTQNSAIVGGLLFPVAKAEKAFGAALSLAGTGQGVMQFADGDKAQGTGNLILSGLGLNAFRKSPSIFCPKSNTKISAIFDFFTPKEPSTAAAVTDEEVINSIRSLPPHFAGGMRGLGAANLRALGLEGIRLVRNTFRGGRRELLEAGFIILPPTVGQSTGRTVFYNPKTGAKVIHDAGNALGENQRPHWHIQDAGGQRYDRNGRPVDKGDNAAHIPAAN